MTESQTVLQPELINRLDSKIMYLGQLQSAIMAHQLPQIYELLDSQQFNEQVRQRAHADSNASLAQMVADIHNELATFLAPELIHYLKAHFQFLEFEAINCLMYEFEALISPTNLSILAEDFPVLDKQASREDFKASF